MKKTISVYHHSYLSLSETFIYRQLMGLGQHFDLKIITPSVENKDEFPGFDPIVIPQYNLLSRVLRRNRRYVLRQMQGSRLFHVNFGHSALEMQYYANQLGIPMTAYFLGFDAAACLKDVAYCKRLNKSIFESVFVNSEDMKKRLTPYLRSGMKCDVVYCGIPLERFPFKHRTSVREGALFLQVCRLEAKKGVGITLNAFSRYCKESDPSAKLVIAGDGPQKAELLRMAQALKLNESVVFLGAIGYQRYLELLQTADVFMQPSITAPNGDMEGIPTAICDAMACGLPVLATKHSGIPEVITDGENGFLTEENDVDGLYNRMALLRKTDIGIISKNARIKIENKFDHAKTICALTEHLERIITGGRS